MRGIILQAKRMTKAVAGACAFYAVWMGQVRQTRRRAERDTHPQSALSFVQRLPPSRVLPEMGTA